METGHSYGRQISNDSSTDEGRWSAGTQTAERPDPRETVFVSGIIGTGTDAHRLVRVGDTWEFNVPGESGTEPMIPDADLAERLNLDLKDLRVLVRRHAELGNISPISNVRTVRRFTKSGLSRGEIKVEEFLLNEADALFLVTRSETDQAIELVKEMIRVYMLARRGLLPGQGLSLAAVREVCAEMIRSEIATTRAEVSEIRSLLKTTAEAVNVLAAGINADRAHSEKRMGWLERVVSQSGLVDGRFGPKHAKTIKDALKEIAASVYPVKTEKQRYTRFRSTMEKDLRLSMGIKQIAWTEVPASPENLAAAYSGLDRLKGAARNLRTANDKQQELFKKN